MRRTNRGLPCASGLATGLLFRLCGAAVGDVGSLVAGGGLGLTSLAELLDGCSSLGLLAGLRSTRECQKH
jgi:hypothetical protein